MTAPKRMTVDDYKTAEAFLRAASLIHAVELIAEQAVGLALNDAKDYLKQRAAEVLDKAEGIDAATSTPEGAEAAQSDPTSRRPSTLKLTHRAGS